MIQILLNLAIIVRIVNASHRTRDQPSLPQNRRHLTSPNLEFYLNLKTLPSPNRVIKGIHLGQIPKRFSSSLNWPVRPADSTTGQLSQVASSLSYLHQNSNILTWIAWRAYHSACTSPKSRCLWREVPS